NQEALFLRAQKARRLIVNKINDIFAEHDFIYLPASLSIAPKFEGLSERLSNDQMIIENHLTIGNFGGFPSLTLPLGIKDGMPFGVNFTGRCFEDGKVLQISSSLEKHIGFEQLSKKEKK
ncbi:MAG: amidase family protein, partial [Bacilli bacterium]|nr:amidase family protein [Bacilli bacterium]